jgi:hypothetical protein
VQAFAALPPGGTFIALDLVIDDERRGNVWGLLMSLDMLMEFDAERAFDYTFKASSAHTSKGLYRVAAGTTAACQQRLAFLGFASLTCVS